jgi:hypothetical protein
MEANGSEWKRMEAASHSMPRQCAASPSALHPDGVVAHLRLSVRPQSAFRSARARRVTRRGAGVCVCAGRCARWRGFRRAPGPAPRPRATPRPQCRALNRGARGRARAGSRNRGGAGSRGLDRVGWIACSRARAGSRAAGRGLDRASWAQAGSLAGLDRGLWLLVAPPRVVRRRPCELRRLGAKAAV